MRISTSDMGQDTGAGISLQIDIYFIQSFSLLNTNAHIPRRYTMTVTAKRSNTAEHAVAMAIAVLTSVAAVRDQVYTRSSHVGIGYMNDDVEAVAGPTISEPFPT